MPAQWTAEIIGIMHLNGITAKALAAHVGMHEKYVSAVMNGKRTPKNAESKFKAALDQIIKEKNCEMG